MNYYNILQCDDNNIHIWQRGKKIDEFTSLFINASAKAMDLIWNFTFSAPYSKEEKTK